MGDLPPAPDVEVTDGQSAALVVSRMQRWLEHVALAIGRSPMTYSYSRQLFARRDQWRAERVLICRHHAAQGYNTASVRVSCAADISWQPLWF